MEKSNNILKISLASLSLLALISSPICKGSDFATHNNLVAQTSTTTGNSGTMNTTGSSTQLNTPAPSSMPMNTTGSSGQTGYRNGPTSNPTNVNPNPATVPNNNTTTTNTSTPGTRTGVETGSTSTTVTPSIPSKSNP